MSSNTDALSQLRISTVRESILREDLKYKEGQEKGNRLYLYDIPIPVRKQYFGKRILDITVGGVGLMVFAVLFPVIAVGIKFSSRGPIVFKQYRTGLNGHRFTCYKFRTMHQVLKKNKEGEPDITKVGDTRIFWFGQILRKTNLDELPQILNVIKGEMSLIGPRPYPIDECKYWNNNFNDFYYRYMVKPGVTGYAQVTGYRGGTLDIEHMRNRLDKDLIYVQKQSFMFDLKILAKTLKQMVTLKTNAH